MMNQKGQSALEYLMTYGWALIVIAIVVAVLIFVTSGATGGVTCQSSSQQLIVKEATLGGNAVGLSIMNSTGGALTDVNVASNTIFTGSGLINGLANATSVAKNANFTVTGLAYVAGNINNAQIVVQYTTTGGLLGKSTISCNGTVS